jgi:hypothetical protein
LTSRQRLLVALDGGMPDRLPVTTHHLMNYFSNSYVGGMSSDEFFDQFGLDTIDWMHPIKPNTSRGQRRERPETGPDLHAEAIVTDIGSCRIHREELTHRSGSKPRRRVLGKAELRTPALQSVDSAQWDNWWSCPSAMA